MIVELPVIIVVNITIVDQNSYKLAALTPLVRGFRSGSDAKIRGLGVLGHDARKAGHRTV